MTPAAYRIFCYFRCPLNDHVVFSNYFLVPEFGDLVNCKK